MSGSPEILELHARAQAQLDAGDADGAVDSLREALTVDPDDARSHAMLALPLLALRRRHAARHEAQLAVALDPEEPLGPFALGLAHLGHRDLEEAAAAFERHVALAPDGEAGHRMLAAVHEAAGRRREARAALDRALELAPADPETLAAFARFELDEGDRDLARRYAAAALAQAPDSDSALVAMGQVLLAEGRVAEAKEHALLALREDATSEDALRLLVAAEAKKSLWLGLWWRWNAWMSGMTQGRTILALVVLFVAQRFLTFALRDLGHPAAGEVVRYAWLAFAVYTWVGPAIFRRRLARELGTVRLREGF